VFFNLSTQSPLKCTHFSQRRSNLKMPSRKYAARFPSKHSVTAFTTSYSSFWKWVPPNIFLNGPNKQKSDGARSGLCQGGRRTILPTCIFPAKPWFFPLNVELRGGHAAVSHYLSVVIVLSSWIEFSLPIRLMFQCNEGGAHFQNE